MPPYSRNELAEQTIIGLCMGSQQVAIPKRRYVKLRISGWGFPPTSIDGRAVAGLQARPISRIAEGKDFLEAYHELHSQILG